MSAVRKKLIEVALPLEAINKASVREKSIRHGHPSTLHLWWARRPLAAARAVIFAQMVDDPSANPDLFPTEKAQQKERTRLFKIIEDLVQWENTTNEEVLNRAREEIWQSWRRTCAQNADHPRSSELFDRHKLPAFHDPFAGGGALPLEAQRLGLVSFASDLNPVAVLINKAMIEIPPKFAGKPPVNPQSRKNSTLIAGNWKGAQGLAEDVRYYGQWMRDEAEKRIGKLYPKIEITAEVAKGRPDLKPYVGRSLTVIAWLWARTVKSPNPAYASVDVPLASTFMLSSKPGKEAYVEPLIENGSYRFTVKVGKPKDAQQAKNGTKLARANFGCLMSGSPISGDYIKAQALAGRMGARLMAIVAEGERGRVYLAPTPEQEAVARQAMPEWKPDIEFFQQALGFRVGNYGMAKWSDLFTPRQLVALTTFSDLVGEARSQAQRDAIAAGLSDDQKPLRNGGTAATAYAEALAVYLAFAVDKLVARSTTICAWEAGYQKIQHTFGRQALPMIWDYAEGNPFSDSTGNFAALLLGVAESPEVSTPTLAVGFSSQCDASQQSVSAGKLVSTDPPYYDNVGYADLSDFFYVWLRNSLRPIFPDLFATLTVPKQEELVATPGRHGGKEKAETFFLDGMTRAMKHLAEQAHPAFPVTIYYAFKQAESESEAGTASTGWETFLDAVIRAGFATSGTWPIRTELQNRMRGMASNALASSIVLVCRKRPGDAPTATRREFFAALKGELPQALGNLQRGNIAPVDLAQAAIGPGMAVYTRYAQVLDSQGKPLAVREALALINQTLDEALTEQEGDFDADSRWALAWFEQHGFADGEFGVADVLARAKNTSVQGLVDAGILKSSRGAVRLLKPAELAANWDPTTDARLSAWESVHQLIRALESGGEAAAAELVAKLGSKAELARELCYRLYTLCERKKRAAEALSYNGLVQSYPELERLAKEPGRKPPTQASMLAEE
jgi:putative DNA methylase